MTPSFKPNPGQARANKLLAQGQRHTLIAGGARSGKTFLLTRAVVIRALRGAESRHAILRFRANAVRSSIALDTLPKVLRVCFPGLVLREHRQDGFFELPNGSQIWLGGLDDKERVEKILGQEFATLYFNECSQIPYSSVLVARTRLAQQVPGLRQRAYYDMNPTGMGHWTFREFGEKKDPSSNRPLANPEDYERAFINPDENSVNLSAEFLRSLQNLPEKQRRRFYEGAYVAEVDGALWTIDRIEQIRIERETLPPEPAELAAKLGLQRIVVSIDPSGARGEEDKRSDEIGISVVGKGMDGCAYVLEDLTCRTGPAGWARIAVGAYHRWKADAILGEINFGGAMVEYVIRAEDPNVRYKEVHASRGKWVRAEPVSALYEEKQNRVRHVGRLLELEDELCMFSAAGYTGERSPNRADALVWALTELMLADQAPGMALFELERRAAMAKANEAKPEAPEPQYAPGSIEYAKALMGG